MIRKRRIAKQICLLLLACFLTSAAGIAPAPLKAVALTVTTVTDTDDGSCSSSHCSLREAIAAANKIPGDDLINFSTSGTILLTDTLPTILQSGGLITIDGSGRSITVSGQDLHRIIYMPEGSTLLLRNMTFSDGYTTVSGGGIYSRGELTLDSVTFQNCFAEDYGGAIYTEADMSIVDSTFTGNSAGIGDGGALYVRAGTTEISNSVFEENIAGFSGGAIFNHYEGEYDRGILIIQDTLFSENVASGGFGGAIANRSSVQINQSTFLLNRAEDGGGAYCNLSGDYQIYTSGFAFNQAVFGSGGAIYISDAREYRSNIVEDSDLMFNIAHDNGGGFCVIDGFLYLSRTNLSENIAQQNGGGGYILRGFVMLQKDLIEHNHADLDGGGVFNLYGNLSLDSNLFKDNSADENGGGLNNSADSEVSSIKNSTLYSNSANKGGGIYNRGMLYVINNTLSTNSASTGEGGGVNGNIDTWMYNTILHNNLSGGNCAATGRPQNSGNNIDSGVTCNFLATAGSLSNTDPLLDALDDNNSSSDTMMPQPGSPAIDGVTNPPPNRCPDKDQRDYPRPFGTYCDIGAVEAYYRLHLPVIMR